MDEKPIRAMVLKDFERFPGMWQSFLERHLEQSSPLHAIAEALQSHDMEEASRQFEMLERSIQQAPKGQVAMAMIDFARGRK